MRKLAALVQHILAVTHLPPEQVRAYAEAGDLHPMGRDRGPLREDAEEPKRQIELGLLRYDGVIQIERYPGPGADFAALITTWLMACDTQREGLADPTLDIELNTNPASYGNDCDVQVAVEFEERLDAVEDAHGTIPFDGTTWRLTPALATPATTLAGMKHGSG